MTKVERSRSQLEKNSKEGDETTKAKPRVVVVGICGSGKSSLARHLVEAGYDAHECAQEHSYVPHMWQMTHPDYLIFLQASDAAVEQRREIDWKDGTLDRQRKRLIHAREHCDLLIDTDRLTEAEVARAALDFLQRVAPRAG